MRGHVQLAVFFMVVAVGAEAVDLGVGFVEAMDLLAGEEGWQALLPVLVFAFDFAFGLGSRGIPEGDPIEVQGRAKLGERVWSGGEEDAVVIDVEGQRESEISKGAGQQIEIGKQNFPFIDLGRDEEAAAIIKHVEHGPLELGIGKPPVGCGIQLPQLSDGGALPSADRGALFGGACAGEAIFVRPPPDLGPVQFEAMEAGGFAGGKAVGTRRFAGEAFAEQFCNFSGPRSGVITAGNPWNPCLVRAPGAGS